MEHIVVVGGGMAALESIVALRDQGYAGKLTLVGAERHRPYDLPPLSKDVLLTDTDSTELPAEWDELDVELRLGWVATGLRERALITDQGEIAFDGLIVATGTAPFEIPVDEPEAPVCYLRTIDDALALRDRLVEGISVVVVGAGWIGAEVATAAASRGCQVTVVEAMDSPLATALPAEVGLLTVPWYDEAGVDLLLGTRVQDIHRDEVELVDGRRLHADVVVVGVGVRPQTAWLAGSGIELDERGYVVVDSGMRTTVPAVVAVGDCTAWPSARYGKQMRTGHWDHALRSPAVAAASLLGGDEVYDPVPYFWSDQLGRNVQYVGHWGEGDSLVLRGDPTQDAWSVCWLAGDVLTAVLAVNRPRDIAQGRKLLAASDRIDAARVADLTVALKDTVQP